MRLSQASLPRTLISVLVVIMAALAMYLPKPVQAHPISGLDGNGVTDACIAAYCSAISEQLSTIHGNDLLLLIAECLPCQVSDTAGLTYHLRATFRASSFGTVSEYYAYAHAPLTSDNVSVSASPNCGCEGAFMHVFAVHGYSHDPFQSATPAFVDCSPADSLSIPCSGSVTTSEPEFVFSLVSTFAAYCDTPFGWTHLGGLAAWMGSAYLVQAHPGTAIASYSCAHSLDSGGVFYSAGALLIDAISLKGSHENE